MIKIFSYSSKSHTARALQRRLKNKRGSLVINWGNSSCGDVPRGAINNPSAVAKAVDKIKCLRTLKEAGVKCVPFRTSIADVIHDWNTKTVVCRKLLKASRGRGIEIFSANGHRHLQPPHAPLYTKYLGDDREEYRVHVFNGRVIDYAKRIPSGDGEPEIKIRGNKHGWILARNIDRSRPICNLGIDAVEALGLDFGAVDIVRASNGKDYVLEVNTAPNLDDTGLAIYTKAILTLI